MELKIGSAQTSATTGTNCWGETFNYDIWANLLSIGSLSGYAGCTQENLRLVVTGSNQISGDIYDVSGNLTTTPGTGGASYAYNAESQLTSTAGVTYTYDGDGKRVKKSSGTLYWYGMGTDALDETDLSGNLTNEYVFFNGKRIARRDPSNNIFYYAEDHLGTSRAIVQAGQTTDCYDADFYPFGGERIITNICPQNYKFTGKERDSESGLDNFGARYNSSQYGRFMSPDPKVLSIRNIINPQKWNEYAYTINNPLRYFDPNGMEEIEVQLRAFIPQSSVARFRGDNRGFTTAQNVTSRTSIMVRVETDRAKSQNPLLNTPKGVAGQTQFIPTGKTATQDTGLPTAQVSRDANGNVVINFKQDASNPLVPKFPGINSDLTVTIPANASSVTTAGTVSGAPAFELNVSTEGGTNVNVPLQNAPSSTPGFVFGLVQTNSILNLTPLPPPPPPQPPPPPCNKDHQSSCPR